MSAPAGKTRRFNCSVAVKAHLPSLAAHDDPALVKNALVIRALLWRPLARERAPNYPLDTVGRNGATNPTAQPIVLPAFAD